MVAYQLVAASEVVGTKGFGKDDSPQFAKSRSLAWPDSTIESLVMLAVRLH